ncbi:hypothetical protein CPB83DRAFT_896389 [Crepidotus variabilis]|uniref:Uncharacterized protein n=1 Tax=Crepidotus variabilis TaxID=179855 RepID=A0A9P6EC83_9AGAR|nr:hypothetical protein CPB83DRAFT_896389 [Crepidotus variabilis]
MPFAPGALYFAGRGVFIMVAAGRHCDTFCWAFNETFLLKPMLEVNDSRMRGSSLSDEMPSSDADVISEEASSTGDFAGWDDFEQVLKGSLSSQMLQHLFHSGAYSI